MIIYYKFPSYPNPKVRLPFAKVSAMRRKHLAKYYNGGFDGRKPGKLQALKEKGSSKYEKVGGVSGQCDLGIQELMQKGRYGVLGRRVPSCDTRGLGFQKEKKREFFFGQKVDDRKNIHDRGDSEIKKLPSTINMACNSVESWYVLQSNPLFVCDQLYDIVLQEITIKTLN